MRKAYYFYFISYDGAGCSNLQNAPLTSSVLSANSLGSNFVALALPFTYNMKVMRWALGQIPVGHLCLLFQGDTCIHLHRLLSICFIRHENHEGLYSASCELSVVSCQLRVGFTHIL